MPAIFYGCHKESKNIDSSYISSGIKSQEFKVGSYWIYQNESTLKLDSAFIYHIQSGFEDQAYPHNVYTSDEYYEMWYYYDYDSTTNGYSFFKEKILSTFVIRTVTRDIYHPQWHLLYDLIHTDLILSIDSIMKIGDNTFYNVEKTTTVDSNDFFTAKSIGVIRKVLRDPLDKGTWNLLRWKIIK